jgi:polysaccharide chain length determinant protein (PEP-CTERM system associated)
MEEIPVMTQVDYTGIIKRRKWSILVPFASIFIIVFLIALLLPPVYMSSSTILIEQQDIPVDFVKATVSTYAEQQLQIINQRIMSSTRLLDIINRFGLYQDLKDKKATEEIVALMRDDIKLTPVSVDVVDPKTGRPATATIAFTLSYQGEREPSKVYQVANVLASLFLEENAVTRERQAGEVSKFLEAELAKVKTDLTQIDGNIARFKEKNVNTLPELVQVNMQSVHDTERSVDMLTERLNQLRQKEGQLRSQLASTPSQFKERDATKQRLSDLKLQLTNLRQQYSEEHPDVAKTKTEIAETEKRLAQTPQGKGGKEQPDNPAYITIDSDLTGTREDIRSTEAQLADMKKRLAEYQRNILTAPQVENEYKDLMMARSTTQAKYDDLMRKVMEARVSQGLEKEQKGERFTIIDPARMPEKPYKPNRLAIMLIGLILSIGAGVGNGAVQEYLDKSVRSARTLTLETGFPVLATIPEIALDEDRGMVKKMAWAAVAAGVATVILGLAAIHFLWMDLSIFWIKLLRYMGV